jgi:hypothetical protein
VGVRLGIVPADRPQLRDQQAPQLQLAGRTRVGGGFFVGLGVDADVSAKAAEQSIHQALAILPSPMVGRRRLFS